MNTEDKQNLIIYHTKDGKAAVSLYARDGNVWMNQNQLAELFATSVPNINTHISNILKEGELLPESTIKDYLIVATNGKPYNVKFYALDMVLAIGFRVRSSRGTEFRKWANTHLKEYLIKGFVMDDARLKNPDGRADYFDELLARIRDIRASEKRFYQKVRDLLMLSSDYDATDKATQMFFAETQNKLLYAVTGHTAAEIILQRADANAPNMNLTSFAGNVVRKADITIAKNYLTADEVDSLNRLVMIFLESAELRVKERKDLTLQYWRNTVNSLLLFNEKPILQTPGKKSHAQMEKKVAEIYAEFDARRKREAALVADAQDLEELQALEQTVKATKK
ncbi:virulence RhuM family protein [Thiothrix winogradskyi]|uniref:Virulence RhuM family protein n=1 Tax=Thiothrix winogradskyi TaxID=96472 RepID=A0ABY3T4C7_9GAMM|nr:virulence RhuM family protein [Thiothrix winogradskyi]UJS25590.1 virulence RhuM family protein [Thiothrix winogradskyi]